MAKFSCFSGLVGRKKKVYTNKVETIIQNGEEEHGNVIFPSSLSEGELLVVLEEDKSECKVKVQQGMPLEASYQASDEHEDKSQPKGFPVDKSRRTRRSGASFDSLNIETFHQLENPSDRDADDQSGNISDPGIERTEFWASPVLQRSCSTLEPWGMLRKIAAHQLPPNKSFSLMDLLSSTEVAHDGINGSPVSVMTPCSADKVMLKKHSSSQVLPSKSKRLWWKLFLWSHRNMHKSRIEKSRLPSDGKTSEQRGGYCSDTLEPSRLTEPSMSRSTGSLCIGDSITKNNQNWDDFQNKVSGSWQQNQWVAFSTESSSFTRVDEWVSSIHHQAPLPVNHDDTNDEGISSPYSPDTSGSPARSPTQHSHANVSEEVLHANGVIHSLNSSSTVAHITGMNLKVIPTISRFSGLRSVNLSGNFIVHITPGSLPKGLHTLNLSRNKIVAIEGLRDLTRLRVLDLSYNKIHRIGQGLSNCVLVKELYLAGNKISIIEGLHRLLKLTVFDLSFNKITTVNALGQLVANYSSLLALNILGNPIQRNVGDDQLRKVVLGLLPQLGYLNKQPIKPQRAREMAMDSVAKAALGTSGRTSHRKVKKQIGLRGSSSSNHRSKVAGQKKQAFAK